MNTRTVEPASAVPRTSGAASSDGDTGIVVKAIGAPGASPSCVYKTLAEQGDELPAASVTIALNVVVVFGETAMVNPAALNVAAGPNAAGGPLQSDDLNTRTVEPTSAVPRSSGDASFDSDEGTVASSVGASGATPSCM
jgi:hypothetical protein